MGYKTTLRADRHEDLRQELTSWGKLAPDRLDARGHQKELERWVFNRFLRAIVPTGEFEFPIIVQEGENPDFFFSAGQARLGIEVTEAVDPEEQAQWTQEARDARTSKELIVRGMDIDTPGRSQMAHTAVRSAHTRKIAQCSPATDALLMYLNTSATLFEDAQNVLSWLDGAIPRNTRFQRVWVLDEKDLFELKSGSHVASLETK
ncbi:hypothetical protein [Maritimibacter fusiformis]|uniref:Restriction endonuclease n=1 Tax=Maritimibacter fusiformis TaxID=2603819 RepID=A0A5D0RK71_9RHOB|nr:hypothetical protein [Maritimibacter fusiformis]TYB82020.1 hypothetical protein FVF75_04595 [Maritimibacter fusiformis]